MGKDKRPQKAQGLNYTQRRLQQIGFGDSLETIERIFVLSENK